MRHHLPKTSPPRTSPTIKTARSGGIKSGKGFLCDYIKTAERSIAAMDIPHPQLRQLLRNIIWDNREILTDHLRCFNGVKVISARAWKRSTEWDNILGYFDPEDRCIKLHETLLSGPELRLTEDLLIALGESLLGRYLLWKRVRPLSEGRERLGKLFEIQLQQPSRRRCFLADEEIRRYLELAQLSPSAKNPDIYFMVINDDEAFTPPGLLFGLLYAWYLNNQLGGFIDQEMSILQWKISRLIPKQSMDRERKQQLVEFFRSAVFRQQIP